MSLTVTYSHALGDAVLVIHAGDIEGRVSGQKSEYTGLMYRVVWWMDGHRCEDWLHAWELAPAKKDAVPTGNNSSMVPR